MFKERLFLADVRVDEDDIEALQQIKPLLCPICFFQALYAFTGQTDGGEDAEDAGLQNMNLYDHDRRNSNTNEVALKQRQIEDLLPSDAQTRALLNPQHKIW